MRARHHKIPVAFEHRDLAARVTLDLTVQANIIANAQVSFEREREGVRAAEGGDKGQIAPASIG